MRWLRFGYSNDLGDVMKNLLTKEAFAEWCEKQPADKEYAYVDSKMCACGQYASFIGMDPGTPNRRPAWRLAYWSGSQFWETADDLAVEQPWTFGALAARLRESQP